MTRTVCISRISSAVGTLCCSSRGFSSTFVSSTGFGFFLRRETDCEKHPQHLPLHRAVVIRVVRPPTVGARTVVLHKGLQTPQTDLRTHSHTHHPLGSCKGTGIVSNRSHPSARSTEDTTACLRQTDHCYQSCSLTYFYKTHISTGHRNTCGTTTAPELHLHPLNDLKGNCLLRRRIVDAQPTGFKAVRVVQNKHAIKLSLEHRQVTYFFFWLIFLW